MIQVWGMTDVGLCRKENQDAYAFLEHPVTGHTICVVCDGMGGPAGGKMASRIAVDTFLAELEKVLTKGMTPQQLREASSYAVSLANKAIREAAKDTEEYANMGTTLVSAVTYPDGVAVINVGDSRAYHISQAGITRITKDHSLVESMVERGDITAEEARRHPNRNLITRALGAEPVLLADCFDQNVAPGDYLLLCSDGLSNVVTDQEILYEVIHGGEDEACCQRLLDVALHRGAPDNVTVVLMRC